MHNADPAGSPRSVPADGYADRRVPAPSGLLGSHAAEDANDIDSWLGYESIHPLTWVPGHAAIDRG